MYSQFANRAIAGIGIGIAITFIPLVATAESDPLQVNPASPWYALDAESGWHFDVGVGAEYEPGYPGSDQYAAEPDVFARAMYRTDSGHRYFFSLGEVGAIFSLSDRTQFQMFLEYEEGRETDDDDTLVGLNKVDATIEGQFMLARRYGNFSTFAILQPDLTGDANKGVVWFLGGAYDRLFADGRWRLGTTLDLSGADSEYMQTEFGITTEEAARTGYTSYQPSSGIKSASWGISAEYWIKPRLSVQTNIETEFYFSEAANSPLIADFGRRVGLEASVLIRWTF
ncbi:MAG: MipA/OmpV family protein [Pseudomonadales bacterium]